MGSIEAIDFHVHFFPEKLRERAVSLLSEVSGLKPFGNGSIDSLKDFMKKDGVHYSVNQPVATRANQVTTINRQMIDLNDKRGEVVAFGTMHPEFNKIGSVKEEMEFLSGNNIRGIKLHPEYQDFYPDDPKMTEIYEECSVNNLIILFHGGQDLAFEEIHGTPKRFAEAAKIKGLKIICGHMGGYRVWNDVEKYLEGLPSVFFDTAFTEEMDSSQMREIILGHGPENILYGSDFPWQRQITLIEKIKNLQLDSKYEEMIFNKNARKILGNLIS